MSNVKCLISNVELSNVVCSMSNAICQMQNAPMSEIRAKKRPLKGNYETNSSKCVKTKDFLEFVSKNELKVADEAKTQREGRRQIPKLPNEPTNCA